MVNQITLKMLLDDIKKVIPSLPVCTNFTNLYDVENAVKQVLNIVGLNDWSFEWSRCYASCGDCCYSKRRIRISKLYACSQIFDYHKSENIWTTIYHEVAHALAVKWFGAEGGGHGYIWRAVCRALGIVPKRCSRCENFAPEHAKKPHYEVYNTETGEVYIRYKRKPRKYTPEYLKHTFVTGMKEETLGKLALRAID